MGIIAVFAFIYYSIIAYIVIGLIVGYLITRLNIHTILMTLILTGVHFIAYFLFLLIDSPSYEGDSLVIPFFQLGLIIGVIPALVAYFLVCLLWKWIRKKMRQK